MPTKSTYVRTRLALAVAARELADLARGIVGDVSTPMLRGERIRSARRLRMHTWTLVDRAVLSELADGATWDEVAAALGIPLEEAQRRYAQTWVQWRAGHTDGDDDFGDFGVGLRGDLDLEGTAEALDQWWRRHAEPWEAADQQNPVAKVLVDGETAPRDR